MNNLKLFLESDRLNELSNEKLCECFGERFKYVIRGLFFSQLLRTFHQRPQRESHAVIYSYRENKEEAYCLHTQKGPREDRSGRRGLS